MKGWDEKDQFDVVLQEGHALGAHGSALCSNRMKLRPFHKYLSEHHPTKRAIVYYGFDANEPERIERRRYYLLEMGYKTDFPLAYWKRSIRSTKEVGIEPPMTYSQFRHANCVGCLKSGKQHWYVVYCTRPDLWEKGKAVETLTGYSIFPGVSLDDLAVEFERMRQASVPADETIPSAEFWSRAKKVVKCSMDDDERIKPCECVF